MKKDHDMKYMLRDTKEVLNYEDEVRRRLANISLPATLTTAVLDAIGIDVVNTVNPPTTNIIQEVKELAPALGQDGKLWQQWQTIDLRAGKTTAELNALLTKVMDNKKEEIDDIRNNMLINGFSYTFSTAGRKVLQTRDNKDMVNWLGLAQESALAALEGRDQDLVSLITEDNTIVTVSYSECLTIMRQMATWRSAVIFRSRELKNNLDLAVIGVAPYTAIDIVMSFNIAGGWPS